MRELLRTNNVVLLSLVEATLRSAGIGCFVADTNVSVVDGSIGIFPRRVLVAGDEWVTARDTLIAVGVDPGDLA